VEQSRHREYTSYSPSSFSRSSGRLQALDKRGAGVSFCRIRLKPFRIACRRCSYPQTKSRYDGENPGKGRGTSLLFFHDIGPARDTRQPRFLPFDIHPSEPPHAPVAQEPGVGPCLHLFLDQSQHGSRTMMFLYRRTPPGNVPCIGGSIVALGVITVDA